MIMNSNYLYIIDFNDFEKLEDTVAPCITFVASRPTTACRPTTVYKSTTVYRPTTVCIPTTTYTPPKLPSICSSSTIKNCFSYCK